MNTPRYGRTIRANVQPALPQPERSRRPKTSAKTPISSQIQMTQRKNMLIVQKTSSSG
jgi:hypothetical protein